MKISHKYSSKFKNRKVELNIEYSDYSEAFSRKTKGKVWEKLIKSLEKDLKGPSKDWFQNS
jgi:hypothetical protein